MRGTVGRAFLPVSGGSPTPVRIAAWVGVARHESRATLRSGGALAALVLVCVVGFVSCAPSGTTAELAGFRASRQGALLLGLLAVALMAGAARRDERYLTDEMVGVSCAPAAPVLLARFAGSFAAVYAIYVAEVVACALGSATFGRGSIRLLAPLHALCRGAAPLLFISAASYALAWALRSEIVAGVAALYVLAVVLAAEYASPIFDYSLSQHAATYAGLALAFALLCLTAARRRQAMEAPRTWHLPALAVVVLLASLLNGVRIVKTTHDDQFHHDLLTLRLASQHIESGPRRYEIRVPGFWLPDQHGRLFRLSQTDGSQHAVLFWSPHVPSSVTALDSLVRAAKEAGGIEIIAVCLANDRWVNRHFAAELRAPFAMVSDPSTRYMGKVTECSAVAEAWSLHSLPALFVLDTERRMVPVMTELGALPTPEAARAALQVAATSSPLSAGVGMPGRMPIPPLGGRSLD